MAEVRYLVRDVDEALRFYSALGFALVERRGPLFAIVARGDLSLWLRGPGTSAARLAERRSIRARRLEPDRAPGR